MNVGWIGTAAGWRTSPATDAYARQARNSPEWLAAWSRHQAKPQTRSGLPPEWNPATVCRVARKRRIRYQRGRIPNPMAARARLVRHNQLLLGQCHRREEGRFYES